mmetsp:Transcript_102791/g.290438  ORF Transcript_102791/g.290438 Transcript_102791/m.290438 type:complete len:257 (-) Transcript_102791:77-847(-)
MPAPAVALMVHLLPVPLLVLAVQMVTAPVPAVLHGNRGGLLELDFGRLVAKVDAEEAVAPGLLCHPHEDAQALDLVGKLRIDDQRLLEVYDVLDHAHEVDEFVHAIEPRGQRLLEVPGVVVSQVLQVDAGALGVVAVADERLHQQVQLEPEAQHRPVLKLEGLEKRHAAADVADVLHAENVEVVKRGILIFLFLRFLFLLWLLLFLLFLLLFLLRLRLRLRLRLCLLARFRLILVYIHLRSAIRRLGGAGRSALAR